MNVTDFLRISPFLNDCPKCGHEVVGTDDKTKEFHGALEVNDNLYTRTCRCGFSITLDANKGTTKKIIKTQIAEALGVIPI